MTQITSIQFRLITGNMDGAGTDGDVVLDRRVTLRLGEHLTTEGDAVVQHDAVTDLGGLADDDAHAVVDEEPAADGGTRVDLDAREEAVELREDARRTVREFVRTWLVEQTRWKGAKYEDIVVLFADEPAGSIAPLPG